MFSCWWEGNVDEERRALLIGIGQAAAAGGLLEPLDEAVEADLRVMSAALHGSGYLVETLHNAGRSEIKCMDESFGASHTGASRMVLPPGGRQPLRVRPLVALLRLATLLAVDVRVLPVSWRSIWPSRILCCRRTSWPSHAA
jgi:hypothetical protein